MATTVARGRLHRRGLSRELTRLRLLAIVAPVVFLVVVAFLARGTFHEELHQLELLIPVLGVLAAAVSVFSFAIFGLIARLERKVIVQNDELSALNEIAAASAGRLELEDLLSIALERVLVALHADGGAICVVDDETGEPLASCERRVPAALSARLRSPRECAEAIAEGRPVGELVLDGQRALVAPLGTKGHAIGALAVVRRSLRAFESRDSELLANIGAQLSLGARNAVLFAKTRQRAEELSALLAVGQAASSSLHLDDMLDAALDAILAVTSAEAAEVWLTVDGEVRLQRLRGVHAEGFAEQTRFRFGEGLPGLVAKSGERIVVEELATDPRLARRAVVDAGFHTFLGLPLRRRGETVGVLGVAARDAQRLMRAAEQRLLEGIGEQVAVAIDNARLHAQVLDTAVLEERERLARELHDGVAQVLAYVNAHTLAIKKLLKSGETHEAEREIADLEATARDVYRDMREAVLGLRSTGGGLLPSLRKYLAEYALLLDTQVTLTADDDLAVIRLRPSTEIQLLRIVQEALSNVRKHADAQTVTVGLDAAGGELVVEVRDDGRGFDPQRPRRLGTPHFGLQTMRERAQAIGGTFQLRAQPGKGTVVSVRVPVEHEREGTGARAAR